MLLPENAVDVSLVDEDRYPLVNDATFVPTMHAEILKGPGQWVSSRLYAAVEFAWGILLRECASRAVFTGELSLSHHSILSYPHSLNIFLRELCEDLISCMCLSCGTLDVCCNDHK